MKFKLSHEARTHLEKIEPPVARRIIKKLYWYEAQNNPLTFARPLVGFQGLYRFRIGDYRVIVSPDGNILTIVRIAKRDQAYK